MRILTSGYMRTSRWSHCGWCFNYAIHDGHYCGAPWQKIPEEQGFSHESMAQQVGRSPFYKEKLGYCPGCGLRQDYVALYGHAVGCPRQMWNVPITPGVPA